MCFFAITKLLNFSKFLLPLTYTCDMGDPDSNHRLVTRPRMLDSCNR